MMSLTAVSEAAPIAAMPRTARARSTAHTAPRHALSGDSFGTSPKSNTYSKLSAKARGKGDENEWSHRKTLAVGFLVYAAITAAVWTAAYFVLRHAIKQGIIGAVNQGAIGNAQNRMNLMSS